MSHTVNAASLFYIPDPPEILTPHTDFRVSAPIVFGFVSYLYHIFIILFLWQVSLGPCTTHPYMLLIPRAPGWRGGKPHWQEEE